MHRVWVTRDEPEGGELCSALLAAGLEPVWCPVIERRLCGSVDALLGQLGADDWVVLTSPFAIAAVAREKVKSRVAVVGRASEAAARAKGWRVERVSPDGTGAGLWESLRKDAAGARRILYPRSSKAAVPGAIAGVEVLAPVLYETVRRAFDFFMVKRVDVVAVASPSAADALVGVPALPPAAALGPTTAAALRRLGIEPWLEMREATFEEFAGGIAEKVRGHPNAAQ